MPSRHPDAFRLLADLVEVVACCDDCGHRRRLGFRELKGAQEYGARTYEDLWRRVRCMECPRTSARDKNVVLYPTWRSDRSLAA